MLQPGNSDRREIITMAKFYYGTVKLTQPGNEEGTFNVRDGKLVRRDYYNNPDAPYHEVSRIELPDGAIPIGVIPPMPGEDDEGDILAWYMPIK